MAKIIDATLKLIDQFSPTLRAVDGAIKANENALKSATAATKSAGAGLKSYARNAAEAEKINERTAKSIDKVSKTMSGMGNLAVVGGLTAAAAEGWKLSESLDKAIARTAMIGDLSDTETAKIKKNVVELSNQTGVAAESVAAATQKVVTNGIRDTGEAMGYIKNYVSANKIAGQELEQTTQQMTAVQKAYNLTVKDTSNLTDQYVITARLAKTEVGNVMMAMSGAAKSAADAGVSAAQFQAAYSMMVSRGIDSDKAAASLTGLFDSFAKASPKAIKAAQEFGIEMNQAHIKAVGFPQFLKEIYDKTGGSEAAIGKIIPDVNAFKQALILASNDGMAEYIANLDKISNSSGAAANALGKAKPPAASTAKAMNQLKNAGVELVNGLAPLFTRTASMINGISGAFNSLSDGQKAIIFDALQVIIVFAMLNMTAGKVVGMFGKMFGTVTSAAAAISTAGGVIPLLTAKLAMLAKDLRMVGIAARTLFLNPIGIAIMAIIAIGYLLYTNWGTISAYLQRTFGNLGEQVSTVINKMINYWNKLSLASGDSSTTLGKYISIIKAAFGTGFDFICAIISTTVTLIGNSLNNVMQVINIVIGGIIGVFSGLIDFIVGVFTGDWSLAWQGVVQIFSTIFGSIVGICETVLSGIKANINAVIAGINSVSVDIPSWVPGVGGQHYQPNIPMLAKGTDSWQGGPAMIHDAGAEIVDLPQGSRVIPHDKSLQNEYERGKKDAAGSRGKFTIIIQNMTVRNDDDIHKIAQEIAQQLEAHAMNQAEGAI